MPDDELRMLAGEIVDVERDILPAQERAAERIAALRVPAPQPAPPRWQRWLYWAGAWRLAYCYREWANWEPAHSLAFTLARRGARLTVLTLVSITALILSPPSQRGILIGYVITVLIVELVATAREAGNRGDRRRVRVADATETKRSLGITNARRVALLLVVMTLAGLLPRWL